MLTDLTTTSTIDTGDNGKLTLDNLNLTFDKLMEAVHLVQSINPIIFYMASEHVPIGKVFEIDNNGATSFGKDIICHPSQVQSISSDLYGEYILRPFDEQERLRRNRKAPYMYFGNNT